MYTPLFLHSSFLSASFLLLLLVPSTAFTSSIFLKGDCRVSFVLTARGRKSIRDTIGGMTTSPKPTGMSKANPMKTTSNEKRKEINWVPVKGIKSLKDIPPQQDSVQVLDTMADVLIDGTTNPTGAVSILNSGGKTYCFSVSCSSCKIPLLKAKILPPNQETGGLNPRIECEFCKATYNVRTGERVASESSGGLLGSVVKNLFSSAEKSPLKTYTLGEKEGQVFINLPL